MVRFVNKLPALSRRFAGDARGVSAVEFAFVLPILLLLLLGGLETSEGVTASRKAAQVASTLGDLVAQTRSFTPAEMENIFNASAAVMSPYSSNILEMKLTGVRIDNKGAATVAWSYARHAIPYTKESAITTLPDNMAQKNTFVVMAEVSYPFKPNIGYQLTGTLDLKSRFFLRPRLSDDVRERS